MIAALLVMFFVLSQVQLDSDSDSRRDNSKRSKKPEVRMKIKPGWQAKSTPKGKIAPSRQPVPSKSTSDLKKPDKTALSAPKKLAEYRKKPTRPSLAKPEDPMKLRGIETQDFKGEFRVVFLADHAIEKYETFPLDSPPRLVIDLAGKWKNMGYSELKLTTAKVKSIRIGEHPDKLRIVLDLTGQKPAPPIIRESRRGLVLIIK